MQVPDKQLTQGSKRNTSSNRRSDEQRLQEKSCLSRTPCCCKPAYYVWWKLLLIFSYQRRPFASSCLFCPGVGAYGNALAFMALNGTYARQLLSFPFDLTATLGDKQRREIYFCLLGPIVESENFSFPGAGFFLLIYHAWPNLDGSGPERLTIISDRDKACRAARRCYFLAPLEQHAHGIFKRIWKKKTKKKECGWAIKWLARAVNDAQVIRQEKKNLGHGGQVSTDVPVVYSGRNILHLQY